MSKSTKTTGTRKPTTKSKTKKVTPSYVEFLADGEKEIGGTDWVNEEYVDTEGMELNDANPKLTAKQQAAKDKKEVAARKAKAKPMKKARTPKASTVFQGTVPCTRLFKLDLTEKFAAKQKWNKGTKVEVANWMIIDDTAGEAGTVTYCNTYRQTPRASWKPETYRFDLTGWSLKQATKKMEIFTEIEDREEWPAFVAPAARKNRKSK